MSEFTAFTRTLLSSISCRGAEQNLGRPVEGFQEITKSQVPTVAPGPARREAGVLLSPPGAAAEDKAGGGSLSSTCPGRHRCLQGPSSALQSNAQGWVSSSIDTNMEKACWVPSETAVQMQGAREVGLKALPAQPKMKANLNTG